MPPGSDRPGAPLGSDEWRERVREGTKRGLQVRRERDRQLADLGPRHVREWLKAGVVAEQLQPVLKRRSDDVVAMVQDLGGEGAVSAMERALLDTWLQAMVAADAEFVSFAQKPAQGVPERLVTCLNAARSALTALGLRRRERDLLSDYDAALRRANEEDGDGND